MADRSDADGSTLERDEERLMLLARSVQSEDAIRLDVPHDLWSRIATEVAEHGSVATPTPVGSVSQQASVVTPFRRRRFIGAAAGIGVAAGLAAAVWMVGSRSADGREVASVVLSNEGLAQFAVPPSGIARLIDDRGRLFLDLELANSPTADADYLEVWMIDRDVMGMVSLGPYHGPDRYQLPVGVDPADFPVVDVSVEPIDGLPTHSGVSVVRGVLPN